VKIWEVEGGAELLTLKGHSKAVRFVMFSQDGKQIISVGDDETIRIWPSGPPSKE
jgi:WD40 repeat protein